ncbi:hypothetical protein RHGRI_007824 [Rhododendron griersonianum]|uniref:Uncharacterized protein n=1 Tax=Rhododendron griersonianum TaxID=479676 RepID=A0AAV6KZW8_9ERIC|nr:hypothetical protein RHGRI_007824 [Rhododendron griersonianum]
MPYPDLVVDRRLHKQSVSKFRLVSQKSEIFLGPPREPISPRGTNKACWSGFQSDLNYQALPALSRTKLMGR